MTDLENREAFEKAIIALCGFNPETALEKSEITGDYKSDAIYFSWVMWNASTQREGFKFVPVSYECKWCGCTEIGGFKEDI